LPSRLFKLVASPSKLTHRSATINAKGKYGLGVGAIDEVTELLADERPSRSI
jgi:hypothetical protein